MHNSRLYIIEAIPGSKKKPMQSGMSDYTQRTSVLISKNTPGMGENKILVVSGDSEDAIATAIRLASIFKTKRKQIPVLDESNKAACEAAEHQFFLFHVNNKKGSLSIAAVVSAGMYESLQKRVFKHEADYGVSSRFDIIFC